MSKLDAICARLIKQTGSPAGSASSPAVGWQHASAAALTPAPAAIAPACHPQEPAGGSGGSSRASRRKPARPQSVASASRRELADDDEADESFCSASTSASAATSSVGSFWDYGGRASQGHLAASAATPTTGGTPYSRGKKSAAAMYAGRGTGPMRNSGQLPGKPTAAAVSAASLAVDVAGGEGGERGLSSRAYRPAAAGALAYQPSSRPVPPASSLDAGHARSPYAESLETEAASSLRQYAEHAMSELLGLYGAAADADDDDQLQPPPSSSAWPAAQNMSEPAATDEASAAFMAKVAGSGPASLADLRKAYVTVDPMLPLGPCASSVMDDVDAKGAATIMAEALADKKKVYDYSKYMKKYNSALECKSGPCMTLGYKEHFHCLDCAQKTMVKKEEMIRHVKWHRKREDSLQHGFMRYSPLDDCSGRFEQCVHNRKQTHYHCIQPGCDKVYVSTSDVQMHANYHRKASAIIMEGFQRFRATEDCGQSSCAFYSQRTTHFHCRRKDCEFTFKNKADMEKHKTYHQKDDVLLKDNFKKFMKYEHCRYEGCHYSKLSNHIHCIRPGCTYVLHSTSQLYAHKRKHEKHDFEQAYKKFKDKQGNAIPLSAADLADQRIAVEAAAMIRDHPASSFRMGLHAANLPLVLASLNGHGLQHATAAAGAGDAQSQLLGLGASSSSCFAAAATDESNSADAVTATASSGDMRYPLSGSGDELNKSLNLPAAGLVYDATTGATAASAAASGASGSLPPNGFGSEMAPGVSAPLAAAAAGFAGSSAAAGGRDELWKKYLQRYTANDPCNSRCEFLYKDHYHCSQPYCCMAFKSKEGMREHARQHDNQERISELMFEPANVEGGSGGEVGVVGGASGGSGCRMLGCVLGSQPHFHCKWPDCTKAFLANENVFARLEHHREHEFGRKMAAQFGVNGTAVGTGRMKDGVRRRGRPPKYYKDAIPVVPKVYSTEIAEGASSESGSALFKVFEVGELCPDELCVFYQQKHYHCTQPRCYHASDRVDVVNLHSRDFHTFIHILDGYEFYDSNVNCRRPHCHNNKVTKHFHCIRPKCDYSFVRHTTMIQHEKRHMQPPPPPPPLQQQQQPVSQPLQQQQQSGYYYSPADGSKMKPAAWSPASAATATASAAAAAPPPPAYTSSGFRLSSVAAAAAPSSVEVNVEPGSSDAGLSLSAAASSSSRSSPRLVKAAGTFFPGTAEHTSATAELGGGGVSAAAAAAAAAHADSEWDAARMSGGGAGGLPSAHSPRRAVAEEPGAAGPAAAIAVAVVDRSALLSDTSAAAGTRRMPFSSRASPAAATAVAAAAVAAPSPPATLAGSIGDVARQLSAGLESFLPAANGKHCGRPFCKLKKRYHFHCKQCEQSFTDIVKARNHVARHGLAAASPAAPQLLLPRLDEHQVAAVAAITGAYGAGPLLPPYAEAAGEVAAAAAAAGGYASFGAHDTCDQPACLYRAAAAAVIVGSGAAAIGLPHYHCTRADCGFAASEAAKLPPHTAWHDRLDRTMGDDFRLYRAHVDCGRADCEHAARAAHFHCLVCPFICTDDNRIAVHRRHHGSGGGGLLVASAAPGAQ